MLQEKLNKAQDANPEVVEARTAAEIAEAQDSAVKENIQLEPDKSDGTNTKHSP